jgi:hypothetical protein
MYTLSDINRLTNSHDGDIYSDLYKDVYGSRPRGKLFESIEAFDDDMKYLSIQLDQEIAREKSEKEARWVEFLERIDTIKQLVVGCDTERAVKIIAESEEISDEELSFYGWEKLEWELGLKYGSIKTFLAEDI